MITIVGISEKPCFLTGKTEDVVDVKLKDKSFAGSISWSELLKIIKRKSTNGQPAQSAGSGKAS